MSQLESKCTFKEPPFDIEYGFYAVMGGFAVNVGDLHDSKERATLTTDGLLLLADQGHFFQFDKGMVSRPCKEMATQSVTFIQVKHCLLDLEYTVIAELLQEKPNFPNAISRGLT